MSKPHGGKLIDRTISGSKKERLIDEADGMKVHKLRGGLRKDVENIASGVYSPLEGFLCSDDLESIINHDRLSNDVPWTIPIILDVDEQTAKELKGEDEIILQSENGENFAIMKVEEVYSYNKERMVKSVYGTTDSAHPGVQKTMDMKDNLIGGTILQIDEIDSGFSRYNLKPIETRILFKEKNWRSVVGFQTRNVPHLGHEYVQKTALTFVDGMRKAFAVFLVRAMGESPSTVSMNAYFNDLTDPATSPYVNKLYELGVTNGYEAPPNGTFGPDDPVERAAAAVFLIRALNETPYTGAEDTFFDDVAGCYAVDEINRLAQLGITSGREPRMYYPYEDLYRSEGAVFIARAFNITDDFCGF
ncbi:MAG: S-layer homology domain-containing protein [Thermoplasmata archaeon]